MEYHLRETAILFEASLCAEMAISGRSPRHLTTDIDAKIAPYSYITE
ncbi:MAG: hypothetical protein AAFQ57_00440 [Cyanobacteria bacterium J06626_14]